jgi:hypothetical protein
MAIRPLLQKMCQAEIIRYCIDANYRREPRK